MNDRQRGEPSFIRHQQNHHGLGGGAGGVPDPPRAPLYWPSLTQPLFPSPPREGNKDEGDRRGYVRKRVAGSAIVRSENAADKFTPPHLVGAASRVPVQDLPHDDPYAAVYNDGPWQISAIALVGIIIVLGVLVANLLVDPHRHRHRGKQRSMAGLKISGGLTNQKRKKTDEWRREQQIRDSTSSAVRKENARAPLYYLNPGEGPQQQHRQRKPAASASVGASGNAAGALVHQSPASSRAALKRGPSWEVPAIMSPRAVGGSPAVAVSAATHSSSCERAVCRPRTGAANGTREGTTAGGNALIVESTPASYIASPPSQTQLRHKEPPPSHDLESAEAGGAAVNRLAIASPFHSFESFPGSGGTSSGASGAAAVEQAQRSRQQLSSPRPLSPIMALPMRDASFESPRRRRKGKISHSLLSTPSLAVEHGTDTDDLAVAATPLTENKRKLHIPALSYGRKSSSASASFDTGNDGAGAAVGGGSLAISLREHPTLPALFMPDIRESSPAVGPTDSNTGNQKEDKGKFMLLPPPAGIPFMPEKNPFAAPTAQQAQSSNAEVDASTRASAPRSVPIDDLHLIKMESGAVSGNLEGKWLTDSTGFDFAKAPAEAVLPLGRRGGRKEISLQANIGTSRRTDMELAAEAIMEARCDGLDNTSAAGAGGNDNMVGGVGNQIKHKRQDLTTWSDSAASLTSPIDFSEVKLASVIGGGGFGQVWKATWRGTPVAVKLLSMSAQTESVPKKVLQEFVSEINLLSGLRHPNVCLYMGACLNPPHRAIITELAAHGSVWDALRLPLESPYVAADGRTRVAWPLSLYGFRSPKAQTADGWYNTPSQQDPGAEKVPFPPSGAWPWVLVKRVASGGARGMIYLHSGNPSVLHRDLKSANLLLDDSYTPKICDFGLSRIKATERSMTGNCGTVQWMAPECLASSEYAEPADVFSFGIILWELLSRECPFDGMAPIQCALGVLNDDIRPPTPHWCPPALAALIKSCVARDPSERPTFVQVLAALDAMQ